MFFSELGYVSRVASDSLCFVSVLGRVTGSCHFPKTFACFISSASSFKEQYPMSYPFSLSLSVVFSEKNPNSGLI